MGAFYVLVSERLRKPGIGSFTSEEEARTFYDQMADTRGWRIYRVENPHLPVAMLNARLGLYPPEPDCPSHGEACTFETTGTCTCGANLPMPPVVCHPECGARDLTVSDIRDEYGRAYHAHMNEDGRCWHDNEDVEAWSEYEQPSGYAGYRSWPDPVGRARGDYDLCTCSACNAPDPQPHSVHDGGPHDRLPTCPPAMCTECGLYPSTAPYSPLGLCEQCLARARRDFTGGE